jgi:hypothetical protein
MKRASTLSVRRLLSGRSRYITADGKRPFAWSEPEMAQLLIDIEDGAKLRRKRRDPVERLYLGAIVVDPVKPGPRSLIDGQHRLAALAILIACARDRADSVPEFHALNRLLFHRTLFDPTLQPRIELRAQDQDWFETFILAAESTLELPGVAPSGARRSLLACARFAASAFDAYNAADLRRVTRFLLDGTTVVVAGLEERVFQYRNGPADPTLKPVRVAAE